MTLQKQRSTGRSFRWLALTGLGTVPVIGLIAISVSAEEPRFRLRRIPQRIIERLRPDDNPQSPENRSTANVRLPQTGRSDAEGLLDEQMRADEDVRADELGSELAENVKARQTSESKLSDETASLQSPLLTAEDRSDRDLVMATEAEKSQKIAPDWPKPWAALYVTGRQHGYIEPCGCTGLENQKGGLARRDTLLTQIRDRGWDVVPIDAGDQVRRTGPQAEIKYTHTAEALKTLDYQAIGFGPEELHLSSTQLLLSLTNLQGQYESPFTSANVTVLTPEAPQRMKTIITPSGRRILVAAVVGDDYAIGVAQGEIEIASAVEGLQATLAPMWASEFDYKVLIVNGSIQESRAIALAIPGFDMVITAGGHGEPLYKPEPIAGSKTEMVQVGVKGMYVGLIGLYDDAKQPVRYQRIALSSQFADSPRMMNQFAEYQRTLKRLGFKGLGLSPLSHPSTREFVGSQSCGDCHTTAFDIWKDSKHAHATDSLVHPPGRSEIPRQFDPECVSCHVTGWNAQQYFPYRSGFASLETTPHLAASGCENCHGPGSQHVAFENGDLAGDDKFRDQLRQEMRLSLDDARDKCLTCHDLDNSPEFHHDGAFEEYWQQVAHYGKD